MIYIIDNGEQFSDHKIYFVKDPGYTRVQVEALLKLFGPPGLIEAASGVRFKILGHVEERWFEGKLISFTEMMDSLDYRLTSWSWDDEHRFAGRKIAADLPEDLRNYLRRFLSEDCYGGHPEFFSVSLVETPVNPDAEKKAPEDT